MNKPGDLQQQAEEFGQEMAGLLTATLPRLPDPPIEILRRGDRVVIWPPNNQPLPLHAGGQHLASLALSMSCEIDSARRYLAVAESTSTCWPSLTARPSSASTTTANHVASRVRICTCTATAARCRTCYRRLGTSTRTTCLRCTYRWAEAASGPAWKTSSSS
jgi:hypothetical protein